MPQPRPPTPPRSTLRSELDALRERPRRLGQPRTSDYMRRMIQAAAQTRGSGGVGGGGWGRGGTAPALLGFLPPAGVGGVAASSRCRRVLGQTWSRTQTSCTAVRLDRRHGPSLEDFEWDTACPVTRWRHSTQLMHHIQQHRRQGPRRRLRNIRWDESQPWSRRPQSNPVDAVALATLASTGVALHELEARNSYGQAPWAETKELRGELAEKRGKRRR